MTYDIAQELNAWTRTAHEEVLVPTEFLRVVAVEVDELRYRVSFLENMYLDKRTDHEQALAAQARAERAEAALREIVQSEDTYGWDTVSGRIARAALAPNPTGEET